MLRKVSLLVVGLIGLSLLVIAGELAILTLGRAPAHAFAGASPQASGTPVHPVGVEAPTVGEPAHPLSRLSPVGGAEPASEAAALETSERKTSLRPGSTGGQLPQEGEYAERTSPSIPGPAVSEAEAIAQAGASACLVVAIVIAALLAVSGDGKRAPAMAQAETAGPRGNALPGTAGQSRPRPSAKRSPQPVMSRRAAPSKGKHLAYDFRLGAVTLQAALGGPDMEWERARLVPT